jgi:hypothetical protein
MSQETTYYYNLMGVLLMQQGKQHEAISFFHRGMETLLPGGQEKAAAHDGTTSPTTNGDLSRPRHFHQPHMKQNSCKQITRSKHIVFSLALFEGSAASSVHDDVFVLFNRALHIHSEIPEEMVQTSGLYSRLMSAVLLYNVGLAHHLLGLQTSDSHVLLRSLEYYSMAYKTFSDVQVKSMGEKPNFLALGFMALANNMGHVHAHFLNFARTDTCNRQLSLLLSSLHSAKEAPYLSDEEFAVFFQNLSFFKESVLLSAPAA